MNVRCHFTVVCMLVGLLTGCSDPSTENSGEKTFADLSDNDVVLLVNGSPLTWHDLKAHLDFELQVKYFNEKAKHPDPSDKNYTEYRAWRLKNKFLSSLVNARLFEMACQAEKIAATKAQMEEQKRQFVGTYAARLCLPATASVERVAAALKVDGAYVNQLLVQDANREAYIWSHEPLCTNITAEALQAAKKRVSDFNARADVSNRVQCARLEEIKEKIVAGADFAEMGKKYAEVRPTEAEFWDSFFWTTFKPTEHQLRDWAFSAKPGDLYGPHDNQDGFSLYKLVSRVEGVHENAVVAKARAKVVLVRITLHAYDKVPVTDDEKMKSRMMAGYYRGTMQDIVQKFQRSMRIQYPNGTNLWAKIPDVLYAPAK